MAISEPDVARYGAGEPPDAGNAVGRRRVPWRRWVIAAAGVSLVAAVAVLWSLSATYQPVQFGGAAGGSADSTRDFPGMPASAGQLVNTFGSLPGEIYVAPQRSAFTIIESIVNTGPMPVTIEAVSAVAPGQQGPSYPLTSAGLAMWALEQQQSPPIITACSYSNPCQLSHLSLASQETISIAIPVRFSYACYEKGGWTITSDFYVKERFGPFTHWVRVPYGVPYLFHEPEPAGTGGTACLAG